MKETLEKLKGIVFDSAKGVSNYVKQETTQLFNELDKYAEEIEILKEKLKIYKRGEMLNVETVIDGYMTLNEVAAEYEYTRDHLYKLVTQGRVKSIRIANLYMVDIDSFELYLREVGNW